MRRREFIILIGFTSSTWSHAACAQQAVKQPLIGFLGATTPKAASQWVDAFVQHLRELGWTDGQTVAIEYRWAEGRTARMAEIAAEFGMMKADIIVTYGTQATLAAKRATAVIPIVFALPADPVASGLVASLARPGGNVTGLSSQTSDLASKRLELLREVVPGLRRLAIIANMDNPGSVLDIRGVQESARTLDLDVATFEIRRTEDIVPALAALKNTADALYIPPDALINTNLIRINTFALATRLPTMYGSREYLETGGLISYGPNFPDLFRRVAEFVNKILRGTKPANLPVEQPTKFDLVINVTTARALGLTIPPNLLALADEVIE
jgi:putative tryptophan/tyrosine transport system substrate-binding protein